MSPGGGKELALFVFIDALGWEISRRNLFLEDLLPCKSPLETVFGYSCTCDPTILTGKLPRDHGHFSFFVYDPPRSPFRPFRSFRFLPRSLTRRGRVRRVISRWVQRRLAYTGYFQLYNMPFSHLHLFDYTEKRDIYHRTGINGGCPTIFDVLEESGVPYSLSDWRKSETENVARLVSDIRSEKPRFAYLYMAAMDAVLHEFGTSAQNVRDKLRWYEERVREIWREAREHYANVRLSVFSDHGMTDVVSICDLMAVVKGAGLRFGEDFAAVYDSTVARFWFLMDGARARVENALSRCGKGRVLTGDDLRRWGCDFSDNRYGELFFLMNPGVLLCPSFMGESPLAGMHGYDPGDADSTASFMSSEPASPLPLRLDDLFGLMKAQAGVGG